MTILLIPKTIKATKKIRRTLKKRLQSFLKSSTRRMKILSKRINSKTASKMQSFIKKRHKK